jgi:hypothetical protein
VLPLLRSQDWWIRWFDFPRPIYAALSFHPEMDAAGKLPAPRPEEKKEAEKTVEKAKEKQR